MDMGFAVIGQLARHPYASDPVLVHRLARLLHASFRPRLATTPLRFAMTSPPSGCQGDFHPRAVEHARHTKKGARAGALLCGNCLSVIHALIWYALLPSARLM